MLPEDVRCEAAKLAFAMLRFEGGAAHSRAGASPESRPRVGEESFIFAPSWKEVPRDEVIPFLVSLGSPALICCTTARGIYTLTLLDELTDDRRVWAQKTFDNTSAFIRNNAERLGLASDAKIILQFDDEEVIVSLQATLHMAEHIAAQVGGSICAYNVDNRAQARLMLFRSDGAVTWGGSCPIRQRTE